MGINIPIQLESVNDSASLNFCDDHMGKLLEDAIIAFDIGISKSTLCIVLVKPKT